MTAMTIKAPLWYFAGIVISQNQKIRVLVNHLTATICFN